MQHLGHILKHSACFYSIFLSVKRLSASMFICDLGGARYVRGRGEKDDEVGLVQGERLCHCPEHENLTGSFFTFFCLDSSFPFMRSVIVLARAAVTGCRRLGDLSSKHLCLRVLETVQDQGAGRSGVCWGPTAWLVDVSCILPWGRAESQSKLPGLFFQGH